MKLRFTGNPFGVQVGIVVLVIVALALTYCGQAHADESKPVFFASLGQQYLSVVPVAHGMRLGMEQGPWQASIVTHGPALLHDKNGDHYEIQANMAACGTWHRGRKIFSIGWGACVWNHGDLAIGDQTTFKVDKHSGAYLIRDEGMQLTAAIILRWTFTKKKHVYAEIFHASTGGSTYNNRGRNLVSFGARF